jgi:predicted ATPase
LAEVYGQTERAEEGLNVLAEALARVDNTEEREYEAELYRLEGELTLQKLSVASNRLSAGTVGGAHPTKEGEAEAYFLRAIEIARRQQAKSLELRAAMSLAQLWQQQGKKAKAHQLLAEIYGWFTEGFDTQDLREAKVLLAELG